MTCKTSLLHRDAALNFFLRNDKSGITMTKLLKTVLLMMLGMQAPYIAYAALPRTDASRIVEVEKIAAKAREVLFHMAYVVQPACTANRNDWRWSFGPLPRITPLTRDEKNPKMHAESDAISAHYKMDPGASIFLAEISKTPWGYAGFSAYEPVFFDMNRLEVLQLIAGVHRGIEANQIETTDQAIRLNPNFEFNITKDRERRKFTVKRVAVCALDLQAVDSKYRYADSGIVVTVPLLEELSRDELVVVLSHEVAHKVLKTHQKTTLGKLVAIALDGPLTKIGENIETGAREPIDTDLIKADRLALRISAGFGVDVPTYVDIINKLTADRNLLGLPTYRLTRGIPPKREEQLKRSVALWNAEKKYYAVEELEQAVLIEIARRARMVSANPEAVFGAASPNKQISMATGLPNNAAQTELQSTTSATTDAAATTTSWTPNAELRNRHPPTNFAKQNDISALPGVTALCRERYQTWLTWSNPKAYAIGPKGGCSFTAGTPPSGKDLPIDPVERALTVCARIGAGECKLYSIDEQVVWKP
jgi:Peptidase family M48